MAKDLNTLIRLNEWTVDERRRELAEVLATLGELENGLQRLRRELSDEQRAAQASPEEAGFFYGNYARHVIVRRKRLNEGIARMEDQVADARERLNEAYRELKKYEIAQEVRETREAEERATKEQQQLNEIGLMIHQRKRKVSGAR